MALTGKVFVARAKDQDSVYGTKREVTPADCLLTSTGAAWHTCTHT